jgi:hypothetical protein
MPFTQACGERQEETQMPLPQQAQPGEPLLVQLPKASQQAQPGELDDRVDPRGMHRGYLEPGICGECGELGKA